MPSPTTIKAAYKQLDKIFKDEKMELSVIKKQEDMIQYHSTLGRWIRNNWGFWTESKLKDVLLKCGVEHPDDMSGMLLEGYWCHKHDKNFSFDKIKNTIRAETI